MELRTSASTATPDGVIRAAQADLESLPGGPWDGKRYSYIPQLSLNIDASVQLDDAFDSDIDPITYQVLRSRFWHMNLEHGDIIQRISGSFPMVYAADYGVALLTEVGDVVTIGPTVQYFSVLSDLVVRWTLENRSAQPGIHAGDIFFQNDPYIATGQQADSAIYGPIFWDGKLFAWAYNCCHIGDLGGVDPGGWAVHARDIYDEALVTPPIKMVQAGKLQQELLELIQRQSREPGMIGLGIKGGIAGINSVRAQMVEVLERYGPAVVKGAMRRAIADTSKIVSERLRRIPDGRWSERVYVGGAMDDGSKVHQECVTLTKRGDRIVCTNAGTSPQSGHSNSTYGVFRSAIVAAVQTALAYDQLGCAAGVANHISFEPAPGSRTTATHPAAVSGLLSSLIGMNVAGVVVSKMVMSGPQELRAHANAGGGQSAAMGDIIWAVDEEGNYFPSFGLGAGIGGCIGGFPYRDGIDIGASWWLLGTSMGNVEEGEQEGAGLVVYRRVNPDSGGAGRWRGGNGPTNAFIPHKLAELNVQMIFIDPAENLALGLAGGYFGLSTNLLQAQNTKLGAAMADGWLPGDRAELEGVTGELTRLHPQALVAPLPRGDIIVVEYSGGGGYGDPLDRDPARVRRDVMEGSVTKDGARRYWAVVVDENDEVDESATREARDVVRSGRLGDARFFDGGERLGPLENAEVVLGGAAGSVDVVRGGGELAWACSSCGEGLGPADENFKLAAAYLEHKPHEVDPAKYPDPAEFGDGDIVLRQYFCPGCASLLSQEFCRIGDEPVFDFQIHEIPEGS